MDPRLRLDLSWADLASVLFSPRRGDPRQEIAAVWPARPAVAFLSVRTAFDTLLQTLAIAPGDEIVMSAVNIESMAEVARASGARIVPVDIELETLAPSPSAVRAAVTPHTRLILIAHLYGARVDLAPFAAVKPEGALLVEDCAQGWGGGYRGAEAADVSLFSFGPIKRRTALGGGVAAFADQALAAKCAAIEASYAELSDAWFMRRIAKYIALKLASTPWLYGLVMQAVQAATGDAERAIGAAARGFPPGELIKHLRMRPPARLLRLLARRLAQTEDDGPRVAAAREALERMPPQMAKLGAVAPAHHFWLLPILVDDPEAAVAALRECGFDATRGATSLRCLGDAEHPTPNAHHLIDNVLYLPPPWEMSPERRERLIHLVTACSGEVPLDLLSAASG